MEVLKHKLGRAGAVVPIRIIFNGTVRGEGLATPADAGQRRVPFGNQTCVLYNPTLKSGRAEKHG